MPVLADIEMAREIILPTLREYTDQTLKLQGLLHGGAPIRDVRVDNFHNPTAVLLKVGNFFNLFACDAKIARHLLQELNWHWSTPLAFAGVSESLVEIIAEFAEIEWSQPCLQYYLPSHVNLSELRAEIDGVQGFGAPGVQEIPQILEHWPYGSPDNPDDHDYIARRLAAGFTSGFYVDGQLVSWALTGDDLSMGMMHTLTAHRRKGIARLVTAHLTLELCDQRRIPYCYVVAGNRPPDGLLTSMGYVRSEGRYCWLGTKPRTGVE